MYLTILFSNISNQGCNSCTKLTPFKIFSRQDGVSIQTDQAEHRKADKGFNFSKALMTPAFMY